MDSGKLMGLPAQVVRAVAFLAGGLARSLRENGSMALLATALSTALWVFITTEQNPPRTGVFPIRIPVRAVNTAPDVEVIGPLDTVLLRITAPTDLWADLSDRSFRATVDVSDEREGEATLPVQVEATDGRVRILDVIPGDIRVQFDAAKSKVVPVKLNTVRMPPVGYSQDEPRSTTARVTVHGPERLVDLVESAVADLDLSTARSNVHRSYSLAPRTARGNDITGVRLDPNEIIVDVAITRHIDYVNLVVTPDVRGSPAPGYWVSRLRVEPTLVAVVGPQDVLGPLSTVKTLGIDVTNLTSTVTRNVGLDLPAGLALVDRSTVLVEVTVQPVQGSAVVRVAPRVTGVPPGFMADLVAPSIEVEVRAEGPTLQDFTADKVTATVSLAGRTAGSFSLEPQITVPPGVSVVRVTPVRVQGTLLPVTQQR